MSIFSVCHKRWWKQLRPGLETLHNHRVHKSGEYSWFSSFNFLIHKPSEHFLFSTHKSGEHSWFSINEPGGLFCFWNLTFWFTSLVSIFDFQFFVFQFWIFDSQAWWWMGFNLWYQIFKSGDFQFWIHKSGEMSSMCNFQAWSVQFNSEF